VQDILLSRPPASRALALDSLVLESLSQDPDLAKVRVSADALNAFPFARAPLSSAVSYFSS